MFLDRKGRGGGCFRGWDYGGVCGVGLKQAWVASLSVALCTCLAAQTLSGTLSFFPVIFSKISKDPGVPLGSLEPPF